MCKALTVIQIASPIARYIPWIVFSGLRAYALSGRNKLLTGMICFLSSGWIAPNVYTISNSWTIVNDPPRINCATHLELNFGVLQNCRLCLAWSPAALRGQHYSLDVEKLQIWVPRHAWSGSTSACATR
ncbi:hypothetical protein C8Q74DRAFT_337739 [Fomes fomentarius]|nr:hypothetical protein C8Q74DRAFT_337739 [Fomes fomentarius]